MPKLLAIETATEACSVALLTGQQTIERHLAEPRQHADRILGLIEALVAEADCPLAALDAIVVGRGPGSFTGVRIGIAVAQGLAFGADLPLLPLSSLHALALTARLGADRARDQSRSSERVLAMFDARMGEVYCAGYDFEQDPHGIAVFTERVCPPQQLALPPAETWLGVGSGFASYEDVLATTLGQSVPLTDAELLPRAAAMFGPALAQLAAGEAIAPERLEPTYLRDQVTRQPAPNS